MGDCRYWLGLVLGCPPKGSEFRRFNSCPRQMVSLTPADVRSWPTANLTGQTLGWVRFSHHRPSRRANAISPQKSAEPTPDSTRNSVSPMPRLT
jgi:hypothetical protein